MLSLRRFEASPCHLFAPPAWARELWDSLSQGAPLEVMLQHRVDEPPSLQSLRPEVPMLVEQVVMRA